MNRTFARYLALPLLSAGIIGGAALGLAGTANAAEMNPQPSPIMVAAPQVHAQPAPEATAGNYWHRHHTSLLDPMTAADFPSVAMG